MRILIICNKNFHYNNIFVQLFIWDCGKGYEKLSLLIRSRSLYITLSTLCFIIVIWYETKIHSVCASHKENEIKKFNIHFVNCNKLCWISTVLLYVIQCGGKKILIKKLIWKINQLKPFLYFFLQKCEKTYIVLL